MRVYIMSTATQYIFGSISYPFPVISVSYRIHLLISSSSSCFSCIHIQISTNRKEKLNLMFLKQMLMFYDLYRNVLTRTLCVTPLFATVEGRQNQHKVR